MLSVFHSKIPTSNPVSQNYLQKKWLPNSIEIEWGLTGELKEDSIINLHDTILSLWPAFFEVILFLSLP